jgi:nitrile hydratase subunit beta
MTAAGGTFAAGDLVMVARVHPPGHRRTPFYVRGKIGSIERACGVHANPEELAYGWSGTPGKRLYRVRFRQRELWPDYDGRDEDTVDVDIYEHWLRPVAGSGVGQR